MNAMNEAVLVNNLTVKFGDFIAVNNISFAVPRGEIFGFLGANGAGKTTTIRVLCGLLTPTAGEVHVAGFNYDQELQLKSKVGYMSQKFTLYNDLTVVENLNFIAALRKIDTKSYIHRRYELLKFIEFDHNINTIVSELPSGLKQQVSLVAALLHDPEIIFLDEPTAGVSPLARARFWKLIRQLAAAGKTIFVTTHYMDEAEQCERIALMRDGKIAALNTPANLKAQTFNMPMYEFDPKHKLSFADVSALQHEPMFTYFETYGLRFHAEIRSHESWEANKHKLDTLFNIRQITPTLEDVFIKVVEAQDA